MRLQGEIPGNERLTGREMCILRLMADGKHNGEIAMELSISVQTVKCHVHNVLRKLNVSGRTQAVAEAFRQGLLE